MMKSAMKCGFGLNQGHIFLLRAFSGSIAAERDLSFFHTLTHVHNTNVWIQHGIALFCLPMHLAFFLTLKKKLHSFGLLYCKMNYNIS